MWIATCHQGMSGSDFTKCAQARCKDLRNYQTLFTLTITAVQQKNSLLRTSDHE